MAQPADIHFDGWTLQPASGELVKDGKRVRLQDQPLQILAALLENPGALVTREQLIARLWPKGIVDFETGLNTAVRKLRVALGDEADTPRYIETLPRKGYRFIAAVESQAGAVVRAAPLSQQTEPVVGMVPTSQPPTSSTEPVSASPAHPPQVSTSNKQLLRVVLAVVLLVACAGVAIALFRSSSPQPRAESLAVLPFKPLLADTRNAALELGMADTLITQLSNLPGVRIRPLSTVRTYNTAEQDPLAAGRDLKVETVLDGSIQLDQQRIRVSARLLRVIDGSSLWSGKFDQPMGDIFAVQDAIAKQVVDALAVTLSPAAQQRMQRQYTSNTEAYQAYVSGLYKWQRRMPEAVTDFEAALRADPNYALAWVGLSSALTAQGVFGFEPPDKVFPRAKDAALKATAIDAGLPQAQSAIGHILVQYENNYEEGERHYLAALKANHDDAPTWQRMAILRAYQGRTELALDDMMQAQRLEPTTLSLSANVSLMLYLNRSFNSARTRIEEVLKLDPHYDYAHTLMGRILAQAGDFDGALEHLKAVSQPTPGGDGDLGRAYALAGRTDEARAELARLEQKARDGFGVAYDMAIIHAALDETPQACAALTRALTDHSQLVGFLSVDPAMDKMRRVPCVKEVQRKLYGS